MGIVLALPWLGCAKGSGLESTGTPFGVSSASSTAASSTNAMTAGEEGPGSSSDPSSGGGPESGAGCGDGVADAPEACDGDDLAGESCATQGFSGGQLGCSNDCSFNLSSCSDDCGNGSIDPGEVCDGEIPGDVSCAGEGFAGGELSCASDCVLDTSACTSASCGDGMLQSGEDCDCAMLVCTADQLGGQSCTTRPAPNGSNYSGGTLACTAGCAFDEAACVYCGNGALDAMESCDGANLAGASCTTQGFDTGTLSCTASCTFETGACVDWVCGNGVCDPNEDPCACEGDCPRDPNSCDVACECGGSGGNCYCDQACLTYGDCCPNGPC